MKRSTGISLDPNFNLITVRRIRGQGQNPIIIQSDTEFIPPAVVSVTQLKILQSNNTSQGFLLDIDEIKPTALVIKRIGKTGILNQGTLYDTEFNKPDNVLYASRSFLIPNEQSAALTFYNSNTNFILSLQPIREGCSFSLPTLLITGEDDNRQIRISNISLYTLNLTFKGNIILELFQERVSLIWCKRDNDYTWVYIP